MITLALILSFVLVPPVPPAPPAEHEAPAEHLADAEALYRDGSTLYEAADYPGAIQKFTAALALVSAKSTPDGDTIKRPLLWNIAIAHERAFGIDGDQRHLRQAQTLYRSYVELLAKDEVAAIAEAKTSLLRVQTLLSEQEKQSPPPPRVAAPSHPVQQERDQKALKLGVGLLVPGVAATVAGAVMLGVGSTYGGKAQAQVDMLADLGVPPNDPAWDQGAKFVEQERRKGRAMMAVGGTLAGAGVVLIGIGAYYTAKGKRVRVSPMLGIFGMTLSGKF
jgi:hypothetical protein